MIRTMKKLAEVFFNLDSFEVNEKIRRNPKKAVEDWWKLGKEKYYEKSDTTIFGLLGFSDDKRVNNVIHPINGLCKGLDILDFGGGIGTISIALSDNHNVYYYDVPGITQDFAKFCCKHMKKQVSFIDEEMMNKLKYDVIMTIDVLEHLDNPLETMKHLSSLLKPRGYMLTTGMMFSVGAHTPQHLAKNLLVKEEFEDYMEKNFDKIYYYTTQKETIYLWRKKKMSYRIPTGDLKITQEEKDRINEILDSGRISEGKYSEMFSALWAEYIGTNYCTTTNSGTSALIVGLRAMNEFFKNKGKIATTPFTYMATINAIYLTGNEPVFVDIDQNTLGMSPEALEKTLKEHPDIKAVMPVHIMGIPCEIDKIREIADKHGIPVIEDNCQGYGTTYKGKKLGSWGLWSACSFFIAHTIQCGEMGTINTNNADLYRIYDKLKSNGRVSCYFKEDEQYFKDKMFRDERDLHPRYYHDMISGNYRSTEFAAGLAFEQFKTINDIIKKRNDNVKYLNERLKKYEDRGIIQLPKYDKDIAYLGYPIVIKDKNVISRAEFREALEEKGIETRPMYGCLPLDMPSLAHLKKEYENKLPVAEFIGRQTFYIGCHQFLNQEDLDYIVKSFEEVLE